MVPDALSRIHYDSIQEFNQSRTSESKTMDLPNDAFGDEDYSELRSKIVNDDKRFTSCRVEGKRIYIRIEPLNHVPITDIPIWKLWVPNFLLNSRN